LPDVSSQFLIARQGLLPLLLLVLAAVLVLHFVGFVESLPLWGLAVLVVAVFRDPDRQILSLPLSVLSPADGRVVAVEQTQDPYLQRPSIRITIEMYPYGVYTTRSPVEGKVLEPPNVPAGDKNPHGVWLQTDEGDDIVLVMNKGRLHNKPHCYVRFGERIGQGRRCGFVHLGGRIDVFLPEDSLPAVTPGSSVRAGADAIATLRHA
jgi:phosphatidylserine decarboxylase